MPTRKIGIVVADDEAVIRDSIVSMIRQIDGDFEIAAAVSDGQQVLEAVRQHAPAIVLTDIKMPQMDGLELVGVLSRSYPEIKTVILSGYSDFAFAQQAIRFGVSSYLLKPVDEDALRETLLELKAELQAAARTQRRVVHAPNYRAVKDPAVRYGLFALCLGNLTAGVGSAGQTEQNRRFSEAIAWRALPGRIFPQALDWTLTDSDEINRKTLCVALTPQDQTELELAAAALQAALERSLPDVPVTVCTARQRFAQEDLWLCGQRMQNILRHKVILGAGQLLLLERDELDSQQSLLSILQMRLDEQVRQAARRGDPGEVRRELQVLLSYAVSSRITQVNLQKLIHRIWNVLQYNWPGGLRDGERSETRLLEQLALTYDEAEAAARILAAVERLLGGAEEGEDRPAENLMEAVKAYLDRNYLTLENLEELTRVFPYSYTYLSRRFKQRYAVSLNRYVLTKRMELAKGLIENNGDMSLAEIGALAGYADNHYFSKAFKSYTGLSPSEYKKTIIIKG